MSSQKQKAVLFVCTMNQVRSPMAEYITKDLFGSHIMAVSAGVHTGIQDGFAEAVMGELGLSLAEHEPKTLEELDEGYFDLIIALSVPAHAAVLDFASDKAVEVEFWPIEEPSAVTGKRDVVLEGYRKLRDQLKERIEAKFA